MSELVPAPPQPWRALVATACFGLLFGLVVWRMHVLQVDQGDLYQTLGRRQTQRNWVVHAPRGAIHDVEGAVLAASLAQWDLYADPDWMDDKTGATVEIARIAGIPREELRRHFSATSNGRLVAAGLDDDTAEAIAARDFAGIYLRRVWRRVYPQEALAAHVLGFVNDAGLGAMGIEQTLDPVLAGRDGTEQVHIDARGRAMIRADHQRVLAKPGADVQLTIHAGIQRSLEEALDHAVESLNPVSVSGVVVQPTTGEILAMASRPSFDPAQFRSSQPEQWRNDVIGRVYESGSTLKPLIAGAAIADGIARWDSRINCENGRWTARIGRHSRTINSAPHGVLSVLDGVAKSDNILMAKLGLQLGVERTHHWVRQFGFGSRTGINLPGEEIGIVPPLSQWNLRDHVISVSFGHGISVTPLQLAMAQAAVANRGVWQPPRLIRRIVERDSSGAVLRDLPLPPLPPARRVMDAETAAGIEASMVAVMTHGTGRRLQLPQHSSAGKTGTTDVAVDGRYLESGGPHIGSFVAWAPARPEDPGRAAAEALVLVVVNHPRRPDGRPIQRPLYFGGQNAGPVVQRVLAESLEYLQVPADRGGLAAAPSATARATR